MRDKTYQKAIIICVLLLTPYMALQELCKPEPKIAVEEKQETVQVESEPEPIPMPTYPQYFDCPLSTSVQDYLFDSCTKYGTEPAFLVAIIQKESNFNANQISATNDYGLCQINACHKASLVKYGITDLLDPYQNIDAANIILSGIQADAIFVNREEVAMGYNLGTGGAIAKIKAGITSTNYSRAVLKNYFNYISQNVRKEV